MIGLMKNRKEILNELLDEVKENLIRIEITTGYLQKRHAESGKDAILHELAKLETNKQENSDWQKYLEEQVSSEK